MMKCLGCKQTKRIKEFGRTHGKRRKICKVCCARMVRNYYAANPKYRYKEKLRKRRRSLDNQRLINEYLKAHPCVVCGEVDPVVLEFDHLRKGKKNRDVTGLTSSWKLIMKEMKKCEVVCANCHTRRTAKRAKSLRWRLNQ